MKIAFDAKRMLNNGTGLGNHARILVNAMMRDFPNNEYLLLSPKEQSEFKTQLKGKYSTILPATLFSKALHPWWRSYGATEILLENMVDIYHGLSNELPLNIHRSGVKSVVTIHDLIFLKHKEQYPWADRQIYEYKTRYAAKHADRVIAVSEETKRDLMELYGVPEQKITVIYPSVNPQFYIRHTEAEKQEIKAKYKLPEKYLLNVGSFFPRKNQVKLVEAFEMIKEEVSEDLILAGGQGNMRASLQAMIDAKGLHGRIHIISGISNEDMPAVYQSASAFVFPSLFEGFGAPVLEALCSGIPVIAAVGVAIEEAAGAGSILIDPQDARGIADKISLVLRDTVLQNKMREDGYRHAQTMTDIIFAAKTMSVYKEILSS